MRKERTSWTGSPFNTSLVDTPPSGSGLNTYSFPRVSYLNVYQCCTLIHPSQIGRLLDHLLPPYYSANTAEDCGVICSDEEDCQSFDHSISQKRCILHSAIEGPQTQSADFTNNFVTTPLQRSHDFEHYEKLGVGNSTLFDLTGLDLKHGQRFYVNLRLRNKLGYTSYTSSDVVVVDLTPPTPGRISNAVQ